MKKTFWVNPYQTSLQTRVSQFNGNEALFEETIAFSFCGGQESDQAWVNEVSILNSRMEGNLIYYTLPEGHGLKAGDLVEMKINWDRRYKLMRLHFATELILELVTQKLNLEKIGAHIAEHKARIDFIWDQNISSIFDELLAEYQKIIEADLPIHKGFYDEATQRRYWKIDGFAEVFCGGTHVRSTKEVGLVNLKRVNPGKGVQRIEIKLNQL